MRHGVRRTAAVAVVAVAGAVVATMARALPAAAADGCTGLPPHGTAAVVDVANVVPPAEETALAADLDRYHRDGNEAIVAAVVPDLGGDDVFSYAKRLFDCWGIGDADADNGVLILVAMRERRVRVELGAGLADRAGTGPDDAVAAMVAPLRSGDVAGALRAAAESVAEGLGTPLTSAPPPEAGDAGDVPGEIPVSLPYGGPFDESTDGSAGAAGAIPVMLVLGLLGLVVGGLSRAIGSSGSNGGYGWRGGFHPGYGGGSPWSTPTMFRRGMWDSASSSSGFSSSSMSSSSGSSSSGSSSSGGSFGGGSSGGGGASGSW